MASSTARLAALAGPQLVVHGEGAVPDRADARGAEEGVFHVDGRSILHRGLSEDVGRPGEVTGLQSTQPDVLGELLPVCQPR